MAAADVHAMSFKHFSEQLYCSGSEERACILPKLHLKTEPGECLWFKKADNTAVAHADMEETVRSRWASDHWDAVRAGAVSADGFNRFDRGTASNCLRGKHVLILGESTTRDLFFEFTSTAGIPAERGPCMNTGRNAPICKRVAQSRDGATRVSFQFLSSANASREVAITRSLLADRKPDAVFVQCMMYDWYGSLAKVPSDDMGNACMQLIDTAILNAHPRVPIYLLGPTYPPAWVSPYENRTRPDSPMARIFASINRAAGIQCVRRGGDVGGVETSGGRGREHSSSLREYAVFSSRGIFGPIDRYNIVGHRKRDRIHPYANAHEPVVQLMLHWMCPSYKVAAQKAAPRGG
jgi:hypothetical protein